VRRRSDGDADEVNAEEVNADEDDAEEDDAEEDGTDEDGDVGPTFSVAVDGPGSTVRPAGVVIRCIAISGLLEGSAGCTRSSSGGQRDRAPSLRHGLVHGRGLRVQPAAALHHL